ncbi:MAG: N-methyl-L-tryptophan oxidase [Acidobacteriota bacterium]
MTIERFDTIVLGAGAMGSAAAYHLARDGQRVLLLEQFEIAHNRGSTHGESRIFRFAYPNLVYARLAIQCKALWHELEQETGEILLREIGGIDIGDGEAGRADVRAVANTLETINSRWEQFDAAELMRRFPQWRVTEDTIAVYSPDTGMLGPTRCVQLLTMRASAHGAQIQDQEAVTRLIPYDDEVEVETDKGRYRAARLVIAAGPWSKQVLSDLGLQLPLRVSQEQTVYFRPRANKEHFTPDRFKIWIHYRENIAYGFPILDTLGLKVGFHHSGLYIDINNYRLQPRDEVTERLRSYLEHHLPDAAGEAFAPATCLYTNTPDEDFIVDRVPGRPHIAFATGCSGHAFKFAIGIGRALADLVSKGGTELEIDHLNVRRFLIAAVS